MAPGSAAGQSEQRQPAAGGHSSSDSGSGGKSGSDSKRDGSVAPAAAADQPPQPPPQQHPHHQNRQSHPNHHQSNPPQPPTQPAYAAASKQPSQTATAGPSHPRTKAQKHVVGGGSSARFARASSSKSLYKQSQHALHLQHVASTTSATRAAQQQQRQPSNLSPTADASAAFPPTTTAPSNNHRRTTSSEAKLHRGNPNSASTSSLLRKNAASRPALKRTISNPAGNERPRPAHTSKKANQIRFEIGSPDVPDDEWVDTGSTAAPKSLRRPHKQQQQQRDKSEIETSSDSDRKRERKQVAASLDHSVQQALAVPLTSPVARSPPPPSPSATTTTIPTAFLRASTSTTRLLLPRTPPRGAPPQMSTENVAATRARSPSDASSDRQSHELTLQLAPAPASASAPAPAPASAPAQSAQPQPPSQAHAAAADKNTMTSRFITMGSHESATATANGSSFCASSASRPGTGSDLAYAAERHSFGADTAARAANDGGGGATALQPSGGTNPRRTGMQPPPPAELSRTQQKLNLERASSSLERSSRPNQGPAAAGPLLGATGIGTPDPRISKLLEKTAMEYNVVRRYQNPVTRSLERLTERLGGDKNWRIPSVHGRTSSNSSSASGAGAGLSQSYRERDIRRDVLSAAVASAAAGGNTSRNGQAPGMARTRTMPATDSHRHYMHQTRLSDTSLVDRQDDSGSGGGSTADEDTAALLRNLWDKNLYLGTSQD